VASCLKPQRRTITCRYRRYWDTAGLEVVYSRASETVSDEGADLELDTLENKMSGSGRLHVYNDIGL